MAGDTPLRGPAPQRRYRTKADVPWWKLTYWRIQSRVNRALRHSVTPLYIRGSIVSLRHTTRHPYLAFLRLLIPDPFWSFAIPEPVAPLELVADPDAHLRTHLRSFQQVPIWRLRDTPTRSLYRLYEHYMAGTFIPIGEETEYFWHQTRWVLHAIPDPHDQDPIRYAMLACLVEELVKAFNWRRGLGIRRRPPGLCLERDLVAPTTPPKLLEGPTWTHEVPPIEPSMLAGFPSHLVDGQGRLVLPEGGHCETFAKRNIITDSGWHYTV